MSNRKKKRKTLNEERNMRERNRVRNMNIEYDRLTVQLGSMKDWLLSACFYWGSASVHLLCYP